ncbi:hypothetical protein [Nocardia nepalensis]|uniref:hypothetical protein n=1 Tax=Nocardia nepalensis TaxID=3375448 RepID=UPI003B66FDCA
MAVAATLVALAQPVAGHAEGLERVDAAVRVGPGPAAAVIGPGAVGVDAQFWNANTVKPEVPGLLRAAGVQTLDWDAGMPVDMYDWQTSTLRPDPGKAQHPYDYTLLRPKFGFDQFAGLARAGDIEHKLVHVNYGTGTPEEAAAWVRYANNEKRYGVKYWEIGESMHFNGWSPTQENIEPDGHAYKSPQAYARNVLEFARAMKAADPTIRVGVGLSSRDSDAELTDWNTTVLEIVGRDIDFVDLFVFGSGWPPMADADLLNRPRANGDLVARFRDLIDQHAGPGHRVEIIIGEAASVANATGQQVRTVSALFLADHYLTLLEGGASQVHWYALLGQIMGNTAAGYGDGGLLSSGLCAADSPMVEPSDYCQPPATTPFPAYYGLKLLQQLTPAGAELLPATSSDGRIVAHATRRPDGRTAVLLINQDPNADHTVRLDVPGPHNRDTTVFTYGTHSTDIEYTTRTVDLDQSVTVSPYSLTVLVLDS